jgi:nucleotide-binding universal stress UspA family protein
MKSIIVPIDFSKDSFNGLKFAMVIANKVNADITLVYVQKKANEFYDNNQKELHAKAYEKLGAIVQTFQPKLKYGKLDFKIRKGSVHTEIVNQAKYSDSFLVVCSTHGVSGYQEIFMGSNAFKIVSASECPIITVRKGMFPCRVKKIVLPIDTTLETRQKVPFTVELAKLFKAEIFVLAVRNNDYASTVKTLDSYSKQVCAYINKHKVTCHTTTLEGVNITDLTIDYAQSINADLISIMKEQEISWSNLLIGPYAQQMVNHSPIPVLIINPKEIYRTIFSTSAFSNPIGSL